jgi:acetyl-CoA acetyltransferase
MEDIAILGVGMHPWGKWGRNFVEYGTVAARKALDDAQLEWSEVGFISGAITVRCGYPGYVAGSTMARALGFNGTQVASSYAACASGATALSVARGQILSGACDVALVVGADTTPDGFLAPNDGIRTDDTDWLRFHMVGATNPVYFGLHARRRMELYGATQEDFALVKVKNSKHAVFNENARFNKEYALEDISASPVVSDPLRLLEICTTSDGGAAVVVSSLDYAKSLGVDNPVRISAIALNTPTYPDPLIDLPYLATDSSANTVPNEIGFKESIGKHVYEEAGVGPEDVDVAEVYDLASSMELDWYEQLGFCQPGEAESLLRDGSTSIGGRIPVNPSGGLGAFGEAVPAQAIAQVCELNWQLAQQAGKRQVEDARIGITANQGLFGHGSSVLLRR